MARTGTQVFFRLPFPPTFLQFVLCRRRSRFPIHFDDQDVTITFGRLELCHIGHRLSSHPEHQMLDRFT